jgi:hypothetical protein
VGGIVERLVRSRHRLVRSLAAAWFGRRAVLPEDVEDVAAEATEAVPPPPMGWIDGLAAADAARLAEHEQIQR